jgi:hypothetical protein
MVKTGTDPEHRAAEYSPRRDAETLIQPPPDSNPDYYNECELDAEA